MIFFFYVIYCYPFVFKAFTFYTKDILSIEGAVMGIFSLSIILIFSKFKLVESKQAPILASLGL
ncbi:hypothetical protein DWV27_18260 [Phocaeicola vulgatus]|jgi:hypothetical protein|nr:hypothetical protein DWX60_15940 [Phocaeicola vulgatus]RGX32616.1 hypothetical protein DWV27_18260 [Phocaeicola vulgatus]